MIAVILAGVKLILFGILLAGVQFFTNFLIGLIPSVSLTGCMGYYMSAFGLTLGMDLFLSIVVYGFLGRFALGYFSKYLN